MPRRSDCIYCGGATGSGEHTFPAALGGRRMNRGILCASCNGKFSNLDALLSKQLQVVNGLIGTRPDHADGPRPARTTAGGERICIDHLGQPTLGTPRLTKDEVLPDGRRSVSMDFGTEQQLQEWLAEQRAAGKTVETVKRANRRRFLESVTFDWSFGGLDAFREVGRIALNFLAHRDPILARRPELRAFKDFVVGEQALSNGEERYVWYADDGSWRLPASPFAFGHQVLVSLTSSGFLHGRVRFFSAFDLHVRFGVVRGVSPFCSLTDIDPLAEHPPDDIRISTLTGAPEVPFVAPRTDDARHVRERLEANTAELFQRVDDRQWTTTTAGLLDAINATREVPLAARTERLASLLSPHDARLLALLRFAAGVMKSNEGLAELAVLFDGLVTPDSTAADGLGTAPRAFLELARVHLAGVIATELERAPVEATRLRVLLTGGQGTAIVASAVIGHLLRALLGEHGASDIP